MSKRQELSDRWKVGDSSSACPAVASQPGAIISILLLHGGTYSFLSHTHPTTVSNEGHTQGEGAAVVTPSAGAQHVGEHRSEDHGRRPAAHCDQERRQPARQPASGQRETD